MTGRCARNHRLLGPFSCAPANDFFPMTLLSSPCALCNQICGPVLNRRACRLALNPEGGKPAYEAKLSPAPAGGAFSVARLCKDAGLAGTRGGVLGTGGTSQLEDKQLTDPQQVAFSPRVPPPGLWVWLYYKDWLPFTFYGALAVLAFADISACCRARIWVWLHR
jgi:hypothetical protein